MYKSEMFTLLLFVVRSLCAKLCKLDETSRLIPMMDLNANLMTMPEQISETGWLT
jgi:hypothetical protein